MGAMHDYGVPVRLPFWGVLAVATVGTLAFGVGSAQASHVSCGDTITADTTLDSDLVNCPNNGILIGAEGITLDLNGHLIDGDGTEFAGCDPNAEICDAGVVDDGHDGVTVMHGRVQEFGTGVLVGTTSGGRVRNTRVLGVSAARNQFVGLGIFSSVRSLVRNSSGSRSTARHGGVGIALADSRFARILHSAFRGNSDHGIFVADVSHTLIKGNLFSRTATGVFLLDSASNEVRRNRTSRVGEAILVDNGSRNVIAHNHVSHAGGRHRGGDGISIEAGGRNLIAHNVVVDVRGFGVRLGLPHPPRGTGSNIVSRNLVRGSRRDGFLVTGRARHNVLRRNTAVATGDDGFEVNNRTTKLTGNRALRNADLGIEAVRGVIDGGGNVATGNGDPFECTHVLCS
jgi:Right handed beta helix region